MPGGCRIKLFLGQNQSKVPVPLLQALQPFGSDVEYVQISGSGPNAVDFHIAFYIGRLANQTTNAHFNIVSRDTGFDPLVRHLHTLNIKCRRIVALPGDEAAHGGRDGVDRDGANVKEPSEKKATATVRAVAKVSAEPVSKTPAAKPPASSKSTTQAPAKRAKVVKVTVLPAPGSSQGNVSDPNAVTKLADLAVTRLKALKAARPATVKTLQSSLASWAPQSFDPSMLAQVVAQLSKRNVISVAGTKVSYRLG